MQGNPKKILGECSGAIVFLDFDVDSRGSTARENYNSNLECCCLFCFWSRLRKVLLNQPECCKIRVKFSDCSLIQNP